MNKRRSYLDTLNAGRQRRSGAALDEINRTLDNLSERLDTAFVDDDAGNGGAVTGPGEDERNDDDDLRAMLEPAAGGIEDASPREGVNNGDLSAEMDALRAEMRKMIHTGIRQELGGLRNNPPQRPVVTPSSTVTPELSGEFDRLAEAITLLAQRSDDSSARMLRLEMEEVRSALANLAHERNFRDTGRSSGSNTHVDSDTSPELDALHARVEEIGAAVAKLPNSEALNSLDERLRTLALSLDRYAEATNPGHSDLHGMIEERLDEISRAISASPALATSAQGFDPTSLERVEARISSLANQIDELVQSQGSGEIVERLNSLSERVDGIARQIGVPEQMVKELTNHISALSKKVDKAPQKREADLLRAFDDRFASHFKEFEKQQENARQTLEQQLQEISKKLTRSGKENPTSSKLDALEKRLGELSERIENLRKEAQDTPDLQALQNRLDEISTRLHDHAGPVSGIDPALVQNLEAQISKLADQMAQPDPKSAGGEEIAPRLDNIERSIGAQQAEMLEAARQAAEQAVQKLAATPGNREDDKLRHELSKLEQLARKSDERNSRTFEAIHDTLLKVVARLGELEHNGPDEPEMAEKIAVGQTPSIDPSEGFEEDDGEAGGGQDQHRSPAEAAAAAARAALEEETNPSRAQKRSMLSGLSRALSRQDDAGSAEETPEVSEPTAQDEAPEPELDAERINEPLEPGSGAPDLNAILRRVRGESGEQENAPADTAKSDFIAAARRAAKAAAADAEFQKDTSSGDKGKSRIGGLIRRRRKPLLMLAGAAVVVAGGAHYGRLLLPETGGPLPMTESSQPVEAQPSSPPEAPAQEQASNTPEETDDTVTGTIPEEARETIAEEVQEIPKGAPLGAAAPEFQKQTPTATAEPSESLPQDPSVSTAAVSQPLATEPSEEATASALELPEIPDTIEPEALRKAASERVPEALYEIGNRFAGGEGVKADMSKAAEWYRLAAEEGLAPAQYRLGNQYEKGLGVNRDIAAAKKWYRLAADQGNASAMHNLGVLFAMGADGKTDNATAAQWFMRAAELGISDSQVNLGILSAKGVGMLRDLTEAYKWFAVAARSGDNDAAGKRDEVAEILSEEDLKRAKAKAELWQAREVNPVANIVDVPSEWMLDQQTTAGVDMKRAITNVQLILGKLGFDAGPADGIMGERTRAAIRSFQEQNDLPATGEIDDALVRALLEKNETAG